MEEISWEEFVRVRKETGRVMYSAYPEEARERFQELVEKHIRNRIDPKWIHGISIARGGWVEPDNPDVMLLPRVTWQRIYVEILQEIKMSVGRELAIVTNSKPNFT